LNIPLRKLLVVMLAGVLLYGVFVAYTGFQTVRTSVRTFHWSGFGYALLLASFNYVLRFAKWEYYLRALRIPKVPLLNNVLIFLSGFVLTVSPGKVGEVFKSAVLERTYGVPTHLTAPIIVAERLTDVIAVVALILVGSTSLPGGLTWALLGAIAVGVGLSFIYWTTPATLLFTKLEHSRGASLVPKLRQAYAQLRTIAAPRLLVLPTLLSCVGWGCEGYALALILRAFGEAVSNAQAAFFYATSTLAGALVPVPGGLGVTEGLMQQQMVHLAGIAHGPATTSMLLIRIATLWWAVAVGFVALGLLRLRFGARLWSTASPETAQTLT
jgi:glycosyltransferase 2 family protein